MKLFRGFSIFRVVDEITRELKLIDIDLKLFDNAIGCKLFSQEENFHMQNYSGKYIKFLIEKCSDR